MKEWTVWMPYLISYENKGDRLFSVVNVNEKLLWKCSLLMIQKEKYSSMKLKKYFFHYNNGI